MTEDTELLGHRVPARTRVVINAWVIGRDPVAWERAEEFVPERFVGGVGAPPVEYSYSKVGVGQDFRSLAFGVGRRGCPGVGFAAPTVELALANLLYHFDWDAARGRERGVRSLCPAQDAVDPRRQTMAWINLTKWTGLRARGIKTEFHLH